MDKIASISNSIFARSAGFSLSGLHISINYMENVTDLLSACANSRYHSIFQAPGYEATFHPCFAFFAKMLKDNFR